MAFDVGINIGEVLLNFARIVGDQGAAVGFEIHSAVRAAIRTLSPLFSPTHFHEEPYNNRSFVGNESPRQ